MSIHYWSNHTRAGDPSVPLFITRAGKELQPAINHPFGYPEFLLLVTTKGMGVIERGAETLLLPVGSVILFKPQTPLKMRPVNTTWETAWLTFVGNTLPSLLTIPFGIYQAKTPSVFETAITDILLLPREHRQTMGCATLRRIFSDLKETLVFPALTFNINQKNPAFLNMIEYIEAHLSKKIALSDLMQASGYSKAWVNALFRRHTNLSPAQYILQLRLNVADNYLKTRPELSVSDVARLCGFQSLSYFERAFKKSGKLTPRLHRKRFQSYEYTKN